MNQDIVFDEIIEQLKLADDAYFNSDQVIMSDNEYDNLKRTAQSINPKHPYFFQVGADVRGGKVKLPYPMNGLTQVYQIDKWINDEYLHDNDLIYTDKLDGTSGLLIYADKDDDGNAEWINAYSRGNSLEGADISRHLKHMNFPKSIPGYKLFVVRMENIIKNNIFHSKYKGKYSTARAMVAGCMNRTETDTNILKDIDVVAYSIVASDKQNKTKLEALNELKKLGFNIPNFYSNKGRHFSDKQLTDELLLSINDSEYELDGYVITDNISNKSVKYKTIDSKSILTPKCKKVHYEISKHGYQKPVVEIEPVILYGTVVTFATGFNCKFIKDNCIGPGAKVRITKSGNVIPYILEVIEPATSGIPQLPEGDNVWNETGVELMIKDVDTNPVVLFKLVLDFFDTLNVDLLKEATLKLLFDKLKLWNDSYEDIISTIIDMFEVEWGNIVGVNGNKIYNSLHRRLNNIKPEVLLGAVKYFGFGFGVRKAKALLSQISLENLSKADVNDISKLDGFDTLTAERIVKGYPAFEDFFTRNKDFITIKADNKTDELKGITVVFTGFRDSELEDKIEQMGGKVATSVSKKTNYVISADGDSSSGKGKRAKELLIEILTIEQFKDKFNL